MAFGIIYKITNKINGKFYIGQTKRPLKVRWKAHLYKSADYSSHLYAAIQKYGPENFTVEQIAEAADQKELDFLESKYIQDTQAIVLGYNLTNGGEHPTWTEEGIRKTKKSRYSKSLLRGRLPYLERQMRLSLESLEKIFSTHASNYRICPECYNVLGQDGFSAWSARKLLENLTEEQKDAMCREGLSLLSAMAHKVEAAEMPIKPWEGRHSDPFWVSWRESRLKSKSYKNC